LVGLKNIRNYYGYTRQEAADMLGISKQVYSSYENGKTNPNIKMLLKMSETFNVTIDYLVGNETTGKCF
jgi:DNA-binding XRE family transcriptional regulator